MRHIASIDLEDWYNDVEHSRALSAQEAARAFQRQVDRILETLSRKKTRCTFFVLGATAARFPDVVKRVHGEGHEIASHGYGHERVTKLSPPAFRDDVKKSVDVLSSITGRAPSGYRAPFFSVERAQFWFYDELAALGFAYSSSVMPARFRGRGIGDHPLGRTAAGSAGTLVEFPLSVVEVGGLRVPVAGGGFWRALPGAFVDRCMKQLERRGRPFVGYLHPHEFDDEPLRSGHGRRRDLYVNLGRASVPRTFSALLERYRFGSFEDALAAGR